MLNAFLLRFGRPRTLIEVGAWSGDDRLIALCRQRGHHLYLIEPNPRWVDVLRDKTKGAPTIHVLACAISDRDGTAELHIANHDDCSSLQEFDERANSDWMPRFHPYGALEMVDRVEVSVKRLDTLMALYGIDTIDLLEVDAQGEDLRVVQSLGARIADVRKIQVEVNLHSAPLYRQSFTLAEARAFFDAQGFDEHVSWTQSMGREANVVFRNRRFHPPTLATRGAAALEQRWIRAYYAARKLPRVLAVTAGMLRGTVRKETR